MSFSKTTHHRVYNADCRDMSLVASEGIDLVVTSPPYPMVQMWDDVFGSLSPKVQGALERQSPSEAYEGMHEVLFEVWAETFRVLKPGGHLCINIGDATRKLGNNFKLFANHAKIISDCERLGFEILPSIIWQKTINAPNKFMGSGTLPVGAYVTLEHEFILIFRKPPVRDYDEGQKRLRQESSLFFEERNQWFLDRWFVAGVRQNLDKSGSRKRSAAFHLEVPFRLIHMFSLLGDTVLDPFMGTGTTAFAAMASGRNSLGFEIDKELCNSDILAGPDLKMLSNLESTRFDSHLAFEEQYKLKKGHDFGYLHQGLNSRVVSKAETNIKLYCTSKIGRHGDEIRVHYEVLSGS